MELGKIEDGDVRSNVKTGIKMRVEAYNLDTRAKTLKEAANEILAAYLPAVEDLKAEMPNAGSVTLLITKRKKVDIAKFKLHLLQKGVSAVLLEEAESGATSHSESSSVRFSPWKEEA